MTLALGVFIAGSAICALAPSMPVLIVGRGAQGIGAGGLFALPFIIISQRFPATLQPQALALTSGVWGVSSLSGPLVGALLLELWGWPAIFWANLPLGALVLALGWHGLRGAPAGNPDAAPATLASPLLLTLAAGLLLAALTASVAWGALLATGLACAVAFVVVERRSRLPIVPTGAWRARGPLGAALAIIALATLAFFAAETFLPLLVQSGRGGSAVEVGMLISAGAVAWTLGVLWSGRQTYPSPRRSVVLGLGVLLLGVVLLLLVIALLPVYRSPLVAGGDAVNVIRLFE
jgi:MFS family permease